MRQCGTFRKLLIIAAEWPARVHVTLPVTRFPLMQTVSVVIPVFNAEHTISELCDEIAAELTSAGLEYEIILVEDHSRDDSWSVIESLAGRDPRIQGIRFGRNFGQHNALLCGIRAARNEVIVTLDDDRQHPASQIPLLIDELNRGFEVVYGTPRAEQHGFLRNLASRITKLALQGPMGVEAARNASAFRAFYTRLRNAFADFRSPSVSIDVLLTWATSSFSSVKVEHRPRAVGQSNYTFGKLIAHAFNLMTGFSALPLKLASFIGFCLTFFGLAVLTYVLVRYFVSGASVPGFAFLASIITIFSGAQMFALGIFGEYLARIHFRTLNRPPYFIDETTNSSGQGVVERTRAAGNG